MYLPVTLKQLRHLVTVADEPHFGRAANACNISQPSLSAQIQTLQEVLGIKAFERIKRQVMVTPIDLTLVIQDSSRLGGCRGVRDRVARGNGSIDRAVPPGGRSLPSPPICCPG